MTVLFILVRDYLRAAAEVYGRICLEALYRIFTLHNGHLVTAGTFYRLAREAETPSEPFRILGDDDIYRADISVADMDRWLVHRQYCYATWDSLFTLEQNQEGKPRRLFPREAFLSYANPTFLPDTPQVRALRALLTQHAAGNLPVSQRFVQALALARNDCDAPTFLQEMQRLGCRFGSMEDRTAAVRIYKGVYDTVPKPVHNGNSELDLQTLPNTPNPPQRYFLWFCGPVADGFRSDSPRVAEELPYTGETDHRRFLDRCLRCQTLPPRLFDPCSCGSGLYYTDCCGKR